jgi:hypothetical protein
LASVCRNVLEKNRLPTSTIMTANAFPLPFVWRSLTTVTRLPPPGRGSARSSQHAAVS